MSAANTPLDQSPYLNRVLVVEDEPMNAAILSSFLEDAGYIVTLAEDGLQAWEMLGKNYNYELVVSDKRMPNMNGLELAARMKTNHRLADIPVIIQTGDTSQDEVAKGIEAGIFYYLPKPYEEETLLAIVRSAASDRKRKNIFEQNLRGNRHALDTCISGEFNIRNLEEAQNLAVLLGSVFPRPELTASGLYELMSNAIEHGSLQIGYSEKGKFLGDGILENEIARRLKLPENLAKKVAVEFTNSGDRKEVVITDQGPGFDWRSFMEIEPSRATQSHGRGIAKANLLCFDSIEYIGKGNQVRVVVTS